MVRPGDTFGRGRWTIADTDRTNSRLDLFPKLSPYASGFLEVSDTHSLYWEQCGNPDGVPVLVLHGGPGEGCAPPHRRFFDPDHYRIVLMDQRGSGRSNPHASLENNTRLHLIKDLEKLREHLKISKWHLFGGSWGSTLALSYAEDYPQHCLSLILRAIFLLEQREVDWFMHGIQTIFPEAYEQFVSIIPENERGSRLLESYYQRLTDPDPKIHTEAAIRWTLYESACSSLIPNYELITTENQKLHALSLARLEAHYFRNEIIPPDQSLLKKLGKIRDIPAVIVQGRYDMLCPSTSAYALHEAWPEAEYVIVPDAGHSLLDPSMRSRLIEATENAKIIRG